MYSKKLNILFVLALATLMVFACDKQSPFEPDQGPTVDFGAYSPESNGLPAVDVMTWNIYVGADVDKIVEAAAQDPPDPNAVMTAVDIAYKELLATNFEERAETIAKFIADRKPHLIGLQEISLIQRFSAEFIPLESFDYLEILQNKLAGLGLDYKLAGKLDNADVTLPRLTDDYQLEYVRLLDSDVVLARGDVEIADVETAHYQYYLSIPGLDIPRGYVAMSATIGLRTYRFVNTHLESAVEELRLAQAAELAGVLGGVTLPIIMVGDFNTYAPTPTTADPGTVYKYLVNGLEEPYTDIWLNNQVGNEGAGYTAPHDSDLRNPVPHLDRRIDLILLRGANQIGPVQAFVLGDDLNERTSSGMWPSDHAGVFAKLHIK